MKRWNIEERPQAGQAELLARQVGVSAVTAALLIERGITTPERADAYLNPRLSRLHDPFLMRDMRKAVARIETALARGEKILIYGDYDVDGATAVALVYKTLRRIEGSAERLGFYIPDRYSEGYGISRQGLDYASSGGFSLVIALDCGIKAVERMDEARGEAMKWAEATVEAETLAPGSEATAHVEESETGRVTITYGIPAGVPGAEYMQI
ncbi:MAG: DHH family phosphoesterase, partial [Bacteroidales bacterium]|nr:DHH family phosphoesterase [Bacteroidales bacterium]